MSCCPHNSFFPTSTVITVVVGHMSAAWLKTTYISQDSFQLIVPYEQILDSENVSRSGKGNFLAVSLRRKEHGLPFSFPLSY